MTVLQYPGFVEGQVLRRDDLNGLRDYLADRDRTVALALGFGIAGGLAGEIGTDGRLHVGVGLAIDQRGETLMLAKETSIGLPPIADEVKPPFDFVDAKQDGFTVVLVRTDVAVESEKCTETGCSGHAEMHDTGVDLVVVPGRLVAYGTDFTKEELLTAVPLTRTPTGGVSGSFTDLRELILRRAGDYLPQKTRQLLATMTVAGDKNAVALAKAAFLNEVLFAALDLLRLKALMDRSVYLHAETPGVALGWLRQEGGDWVWDCGYRHAWTPQVGVALALFGGTCGDPALPWVQRLTSIIDTFEPPTIPPDDKPPKVIDPPFICKYYKYRIHVDCMAKKYPPVEIGPEWREKLKKIPDLGDPPFDFLKPIQPEDIYKGDSADPVDFGVIDLINVLGSDADTTQGLLKDVIEKSGVTKAGVDVLTADQANKTPGFTFDGVAGPADRVVLIKNSANRVIGTGRVPLTQSMRDLGVQLPEVVGKANSANARVDEALGKYNTLNSKVDGFNNTFVSKEVFNKAELERNNFQTNITQQLSGLNTMVHNEVAVQLPNLVSGQFSTLQDQLQKVNGRVDTLFTRQPVTGVRDVAVSDNITTVLQGLRDSVAATAPADKQAEVDTHLKEVDLGLARIDAIKASGGSPIADNPEVLTSVMDSMVAGLKAAGAPARTVTAVTRQVSALRKSLNVGG